MTDTLKTFIDDMTSLIGTSVAGLFLTLGTVMFFYAVVRFIMKRSSGDAKGLEDAKSMLGWSILALTLMFSIWGVVGLFQTIFKNDTPTGNAIVAPSVKVTGSTSGGSTGSANGTKTAGQTCNILPGLNSECVSGYQCKTSTTISGGQAITKNTCTKI